MPNLVILENDCSRLVPYRVRTSARARRMRLRVEAGRGLEVVLPKGGDPAAIEPFLEYHRQWIEKCLKKYRLDQPTETGLPETLCLHDGQLAFPVRLGPVRTAVLYEEQLMLPRDIDMAAQLKALRDWVRSYAGQVLEPRLLALADEHGYSVSTVRIRWQKSRWGSCSSRKAINLNACLVFFPDELCRLVMLHELAHLDHLNHSERFWQTLLRLEPRALELDRKLARGWKYIPAWVHRAD